MDYPVKFFHSGMTGAPTLSNGWGDLINVLDACLVTGFNLKAVDSITRVGNVATLHISSGVGTLDMDQVVLVSGADQAEYNGEKRITAKTASSVSFEVTGTPATPATTSTDLSVKIAPLGWEKPFVGTNKAAYRSTDPMSSRRYLRVDDGVKPTNGFNSYDNNAWAKWANVGICENMTDIDTIVGAQAPYDPNYPEQNWKQRTNNQFGWYKWYHGHAGGYENNGDGGAGARNWIIVGDSRFFWLMTTFAPGFNWFGRVLYCFGDPISFKPGDAYDTVLHATDALVSVSGGTYLSDPGGASGDCLTRSCNVLGSVVLRNYTQMGNYVRWGITSLNINNSSQRMGKGGIPFPNGPDYAMWLLPCYMIQEDGHMRGMVPGLRWMPHEKPYSDMAILGNVVNEDGRKFLLPRYSSDGVAEYGQVVFDITGPWR